MSFIHKRFSWLLKTGRGLFCGSCLVLSSLSLYAVAETDLNSHAMIHQGASGSFEDSLLHYMHSKWLAYSSGLPVAYKPFPYSDQLMLHLNEHLVESELEESDVLNTHCLPVNWEDPTFRALLREQITPVSNIETVPLPEGSFTVAVYIPKSAASLSPLESPPLNWYCEQVRYIAAMCGHHPVYVCVFTDDPTPVAIKKFFKKIIPNYNLTFECKALEKARNKNVLEDLFSMAQFDCLIRSSSHYSFIAGVIGKSKMEIYPTSYKNDELDCYIDKTRINFRSPLGLYKCPPRHDCRCPVHSH